MIAILLDLFAVYFMRRYFSSKIMYLLFGLVAGFLSSSVGSLLVGLWFDEALGIILIRAISGVVPHTLFIYICLFLDLWNSKKERQKKAAIESLNAEDKYWEANEKIIIANILGKYQSIDLSAVLRNEILEENLTSLSTEEIIERLNKEHFSDDSIPSALRVLNTRLKS